MANNKQLTLGMMIVFGRVQELKFQHMYTNL